MILKIYDEITNKLQINYLKKKNAQLGGRARAITHITIYKKNHKFFT